MKSRVRKGIPSSLRHEIWQIICNLKALKADSHHFYDELIAKEKWVCQDIIENDVRRTFTTNIYYMQGIGKKSISDILKAVSFAFPTVGYTQGMSFIAGMFSFYLTNEDSFWMFVYLFDKRNWMIYFQDLATLDRFSFIFEKLLERYMPKVLEIMRAVGCEGRLYISKYITTFFASMLPISFCVRIFDIFIFENEKIIFRALLAIFKFLEPHLLQKKSLDGFIGTLSESGRYMVGVTPDQFIEQCLKFTFSQTELGKLDYEYSFRQKN